MRQSIGTIWITGLVITFMLIFIGYLTFMISFSEAEESKNGVISIIEKRNGITSQKPRYVDKIRAIDYNPASGSKKTTKMYVDYGTLQSINLYLRGRGYKNKGSCTFESGEVWYGVTDLKMDSNKVSYEEITKQKSGQKVYYYCFSKFAKSTSSSAHYKVKLFYVFDLPIISALNVPVEGKTNLINIPSNCEINKAGYNHNDGLCPSSDRNV